MELRDWLAGVAAAAVLGVTQAHAQAPRSLFDALPTNVGISPVTSGFERAVPSAPSGPQRPVAAKAEPLPVAPSKPEALPIAPARDARASAGSKAATTVLPPIRPAALSQPVPAGQVASGSARTDKDMPAGDRRRRLASADPVKTLPPEAAAPAPPLPAPPVSPPAAEIAAPSKPMSRAARRRAREEEKRQAAAAAAAPPAATPTFATNPFLTLFGAAPAQNRGELLPPVTGRAQIDALVSHHARLNNVPEALVHRVIVRESKYNPRAVGRGGAMGLMQIKTATARGVGYMGNPAGLLDAETNLTYGIKYLAGAWRVSGGSHDRAVSHYAGGYYYAAKRQGFAGSRRRGQAEPATTASAPQPPSFFTLFSPQQASAQ